MDCDDSRGLDEVHRRFRAWLEELAIDTGAAARLLGCDRSYVSLLQTGRRIPSLRIAARIERLSAASKRGPIRAVEWADALEMNARVSPAPASSSRGT